MPEQAQLDVERIAELRREVRARILQALSTGFINDRLLVKDAPPGMRCVWARNRQEDIERFRLLGYEVVTGYGDQYHKDGSGARILGDSILMAIPQEEYDIFQEVRQELVQGRYDDPKRKFVEELRREGVEAHIPD